MTTAERRDDAERDLLIIDSWIAETILPWQWVAANELLASVANPEASEAPDG